jgi:hypothetical protein
VPPSLLPGRREGSRWASARKWWALGAEVGLPEELETECAISRRRDWDFEIGKTRWAEGGAAVVMLRVGVRAVLRMGVNLDATADQVDEPVFRDRARCVEVELHAAIDGQRRLGDLDDEIDDIGVRGVVVAERDDSDVGFGLGELEGSKGALNAYRGPAEPLSRRGPAGALPAAGQQRRRLFRPRAIRPPIRKALVASLLATRPADTNGARYYAAPRWPTERAQPPAGRAPAGPSYQPSAFASAFKSTMSIVVIAMNKMTPFR